MLQRDQITTEAVHPLPLLAGGGGEAPAGVAPLAEELAAQASGPRDIRYVKTLRISVTDHCNLRCIYCMPEEGVEWLPREALLTYEEIVEVARAAIAHGIREFKLTGGEPLLRHDLSQLLRMLRALPGTGEISLTTNGILLERDAAALREAGLDRITVSLDTLDPLRFRRITRNGDLTKVQAGIELAERIGLGPVKINVVVMRSQNLDEVVEFAAMTLNGRRTVRFIEFMPLGRSKLLTSADEFVPYDEIRARIEAALGLLTPADADPGAGPARVFRLRGGAGKVGFIHAMSAPFCSTCNRLRLTPDGLLRSCLFDGGEIDVKPMLRPGTRPAELRRAFIDCVVLKPDAHQYYGTRQMSRIGG
jgi:cyclic pyranopterin phosphate synthase